MPDYTWGELYVYAKTRQAADPTFFDTAVYVATPMGEFHPVEELLESEDDEIMEDGQPYLQLAELP